MPDLFLYPGQVPAGDIILTDPGYSWQIVSSNITLDTTSILALGALGAVEVYANLSSTLANITSVLTGKLLVASALTKTLDDVNNSFIGKLEVKGALEHTLVNITKSITGTILTKGITSSTLSNLLIESTGYVIGGTVVNSYGMLEVLLSSLSYVSSGKVKTKGKHKKVGGFIRTRNARH
jgi:hypothetical protein